MKRFDPIRHDTDGNAFKGCMVEDGLGSYVMHADAMSAIEKEMQRLGVTIDDMSTEITELRELISDHESRVEWLRSDLNLALERAGIGRIYK